MKKLIQVAIFVILQIHLFSQSGTIQGIVIDYQSEITIIGATIELLSSDDVVGTTTDEDGHFVLSNVPLGRNVIRISYLGYESITLPNIDVTTGKDVLVNISLKEQINTLSEIVVLAKSTKDRPQNEMATISARQFSLEEVNRYSGGRSDVARLVANFAGVSAPDDSRNDIVIRGNSPTGVLWKIEGIPVPSPNHYSTFGTTGSPVSALNPNMLRSSDFLTSAFPAEYGNANAGVFDIGFRNGNKERAEYTFQIGAFSGFEGIAEGPMGKKGGSYLIAGRYSFVGLVGAGGTDAVPNYQDLSFKIDLGKSSAGRFTLFGIGGQSNIDFLKEEISPDDLFSEEDEDSFVKGGFGLVGLKHNLIIGDKTYIRTIIGASRRNNTFELDRYYNLDMEDEFKLRILEVDDTESRYSFSSYINTKLNSQQTFRAGVLYENFANDSFLRDREEAPDLNNDGEPDWFTVYDFNGRTGLLQPFVQSNYRFNKELSVQGGIHGQYSTMNQQMVIEPRASISYQLNDKNKVTLGYGVHNQNAPLPILFLNEQIGDELVQTNKDLDFVRSQHYVLGYDRRIADNWRFKAEVYYQSLDRVPVESFPSSYSTLTEGADFGFSDDKTSLVSEGTGSNQGIEITVEKFYSKGYHLLATASFFDSKYTGSDGIERSTPFDNGYVLNFLAGREFKLGKTGKNAFMIDTKITTSGGKWYTPIDLEASRLAQFEVLEEEQAFTRQFDQYLRWDLKLGIKLNSSKRKIAHMFYLDFQNVTNRENVFIRQYNRTSGEIDQDNQVGFFPDFLYRVQF